MKQKNITILGVDEVKITLVMDNSLDLLIPSSEIAQRYFFSPKWLNQFEAKPNVLGAPLPYAEHGFSALISVTSGEKHGNILFDTGSARKGSFGTWMRWRSI